MEATTQQGSSTEQPKVAASKLAVFHITKGQGDAKSVWTRVGVAFRNRDGSPNVILNVAIPAGEKLQIRQETPKAKAPEAPAAA